MPQLLRSLFAAAIAATLIASCSTTSTSMDAGADAGPQVPLSMCFPGWYYGTPTQPCGDWCTVSKAPHPECAQADCTQLDVSGYLANNVVIEVSLFYSKTSGTMTTWTDYTKRTYSATADQIQFTPGNPLSATCFGGSLLVLGDVMGYRADNTRAWPQLASSIERQIASGMTSWVSAPVN